MQASLQSGAGNAAKDQNSTKLVTPAPPLPLPARLLPGAPCPACATVHGTASLATWYPLMYCAWSTGRYVRVLSASNWGDSAGQLAQMFVGCYWPCQGQLTAEVRIKQFASQLSSCRSSISNVSSVEQ
jgi:hypothetical protein